MTRTILIPTDFSDSAKNAAQYAIDLFGAKAHYLLVSSYGDDSSRAKMRDISEELEESTMEYLEEQAKELIERDGAIQIELIADEKPVIDAINDLSNYHDVDCVVMGTHGLTALEEIFMGSTTYGVINEVSVPVIAVPTGAQHEELDHVVLAADNRKLDDNLVLKPVIALCADNDSTLHILHIADPDDPDTHKPAREKELSERFSMLKHQFHNIKDEDPAHGISEFVKSCDAKLVIMLARQRSFFHRIIDPSVTKKVLIHSKIPILTIPDSMVETVTPANEE